MIGGGGATGEQGCVLAVGEVDFCQPAGIAARAAAETTEQELGPGVFVFLSIAFQIVRVIGSLREIINKLCNMDQPAVQFFHLLQFIKLQQILLHPTIINQIFILPIFLSGFRQRYFSQSNT